MRFNVAGFFIGALCALVLFIVANALVSFENSSLLFGLLAIALWVYLTVNPPAAFTRRA